MQKNNATLVIEEDHGPMVTIPLSDYNALIKADTILQVMHAIKHNSGIKYPDSSLHDILIVAPNIIAGAVREHKTVEFAPVEVTMDEFFALLDKIGLSRESEPDEKEDAE
jgi:hypothetical protein